MTLKPVLGETAAVAQTIHGTNVHDRFFPDHVLRSQEFAACGGDLFGLFEEMEEKDGHLFSALQTRKNGLLARQRYIAPAGETDAERRVADFVEDVLNAIPNFAQTLQHILDAIGKGFSVQEVMWCVRPDGKIGIREIKSRYPGRFIFDAQGNLCLTRAQHILRPWNQTVPAQALPERKFLVCTFGGQYSNPYGKGLLARAFWYYWFKKHTVAITQQIAVVLF